MFQRMTHTVIPFRSNDDQIPNRNSHKSPIYGLKGEKISYDGSFGLMNMNILSSTLIPWEILIAEMFSTFLHFFLLPKWQPFKFFYWRTLLALLFYLRISICLVLKTFSVPLKFMLLEYGDQIKYFQKFLQRAKQFLSNYYLPQWLSGRAGLTNQRLLDEDFLISLRKAFDVNIVMNAYFV